MAVATPTDKPWAVISICEKGDFPEIHTNEAMVGRLNLKFHDVDFFKNGEREDGRILFDEALADQVLNFHNEMKAKGVSVVYVHCLMGMCRSAAVAAALDKIEKDDDHVWFATKRPNMRVYRTILEVAADKGLI